MRNLFIWGWWQGNNLGDNWIKRVLGQFFPEADFVDTSVQKFPKNSFVICGGGGLFIYDVIAPWDRISKKIEYGMLGLGAEFSHESMKAIEVCKRSKFFYVRDQYSLDCMHLSGVERSYDLTFAMPLNWTDLKIVCKNKLFMVWRDGHDLLYNEKFRTYIRPSGGGDDYDKWKNLIEKHFSEIVEDDFQTKEDNIEERVSDCGFVISGRYHGVVAAIQKGLPFIAIDICPKIRALLEECELDEYCIKISETNKIEELILKAWNNIDAIREKERKYVEKAKMTLLKQIQNVKLEILKSLKPLKIIHYGSYWMGANDVVNTMSDDLLNESCCKKIDLKLYSKHPDKRIKEIYKTPNGNVCVLNHSRVIQDIHRQKADAVVLNSGGLVLEDQTFEQLNAEGVVSAGISLSDPDVFPYNGKIYASKFDFFYTNSKYSLLNEYPATGANVRIMPFAASNRHHYYMPKVERRYDVVVVGHAREDRMSIIEGLEKICKVGTYGAGWHHSLGVVNGKKHVEAINSGKMYLSFSRTMAGFDNVKVGLFEAMACNQVVITSYMEELRDYFDVGTEILCYKDENELYDLVAYYIKHDEERERIRNRGYNRFLRCHTYEKRWDEMLKDIYQNKGLL